QVVLGYPACNLVVEPHLVALSGPTTRASHRDLSGSGWAVAALLRPAAGPVLLSAQAIRGPVPAGARAGRAATIDVSALVNRQWPVERDELRTAVTAAMARGSLPDAVAELEGFLRGLRDNVTADGLLANRMQELVEGSPLRT